MDLNDYFDPVSLEKPAYNLLPGELTFSRKIKIHTPDHKIGNITEYDVAIFGIPGDKYDDAGGNANGADAVRKMLYQMSGLSKKLKINDLGNLKTTAGINDTYYALRDIIRELSEKEVVSVLIGGSQDLGYAVDMALYQKKSLYQFLSIDSRLDFGSREKKITSGNYLDSVFREKDPKFFNYVNLGHQAYFAPERLTDQISKRGYESIRLGAVRSNLSFVEPYIRDSSFVSIDLCCIRQSDAPGVTFPSPNGFFGHEICQLARYAGAASELRVFGLFGLNPLNDLNNQTSHLAAQIIWYFLDGCIIKRKEFPQYSSAVKYIVTMQSAGLDIAFYKSRKTDRWWMEIPVINPVTGLNYLVSCNEEDYQTASKDEIPERWWKAFHRLA
jgi:formiminoglutamase